jgi:hypothetical protein
MAWRKTDEQKKAEGSYRPDRAAPVKTVDAAELALTTTITTLAAAQKKLATLKGSKTATARRNLQKLIEIQTRRLQQAREDMSNAMRQAAVKAAAPSIRDGLELMSDWDADHADPPLSADERDAYDFIVIDGRGCPCGAGLNAGVVLGENEGDEWEFCSVCKKPLPWGRRNVAEEKKSAREGADRYIKIRQNAVDAVNAQLKKD